MSKKLFNHCDLTFHDIKKVDFEVRGPYLGSEVLKVNFYDAEGNQGVLVLYFDPNIKVESIGPLHKLKKIVADIGGLKLKNLMPGGKA